MPDPAPADPATCLVASYAGVSVPTTDQMTGQGQPSMSSSHGAQVRLLGKRGAGSGLVDDKQSAPSAHLVQFRIIVRNMLPEALAVIHRERGNTELAARYEEAAAEAHRLELELIREVALPGVPRVGEEVWANPNWGRFQSCGSSGCSTQRWTTKRLSRCTSLTLTRTRSAPSTAQRSYSSTQGGALASSSSATREPDGAASVYAWPEIRA